MAGAEGRGQRVKDIFRISNFEFRISDCEFKKRSRIQNSESRRDGRNNGILRSWSVGR
jgi:hypothetical protein